ncbi:MAG: Asp-tRNA(Asn)/Glu-tRNA(Gln) amidotransferase GatCAB subunit B, partial [Bacteroidota bacterium]
FNVDTGETYAMRTKEELNDYRYFPDPDLSPLHLSDEWLEKIRADMPELPWEIKNRLITKYTLPDYDANFIVDSNERVTFFEEVACINANYKSIANWIMGPIQSYQNTTKSNNWPITKEQLAELIALIDDHQLSYTAASGILFQSLVANPAADVRTVATELDLLLKETNADVEVLIQSVIQDFPDKVQAYKSSKKGKALLGLFMGELMKRSAGKLDPKELNQILVEKLNEA